jgi:hypothetical protein
MTANLPQESLLPTQRNWRDLRNWRLCLGLCLGPIVLAALILILFLTDAESTASDFIWIVGLLLLAIAWSQITGWIYLLALVRPRGRIARQGCLLLGLTSIALIPPIAVFFAVLPGSQAEPGNFLEDLNQKPGATLATLVVTEIACALFGLLSGWLFWRFGARPAAMTPAPSASYQASEPRGGILTPLLLAAVPTAIPMIPSALTGLGALGIIVFACPVIWLIGGSCYAKLRKCFRLHECLLLGMLLGFLVTPAAVLLAGLVGQFTNPELPSVTAPLQEAGFTAIIRAGVIELPFGLMGGWLFWRMAGLPTTRGMSQADPALERRWRDLRKGRLFAALAVAPAVSIILFAAMSTIAFGTPTDPSFKSADIGPALLTFVAWCCAISLPYLLLICRRRDCVRLRDCLLMETFAFCLFPSLNAVSLKFGLSVADGSVDTQTGIGGIFFYVVAAALLYLPFGLLSGWMFWRIGVRPARAPDVAAASVFE